MTDAAWNVSLAIGKAFERRCVELVRKQPRTLQILYDPDGTQKSHDFSLTTTTGSYHTAECKCDTMAAHTGNCFIQTKKDGRPHGIVTTRAEFWFFNIGDPTTGDILVLRAIALYKHLSRLSESGQIRRIDGAGRSANTAGYLLTVAQLKSCPGAWEWKTQNNGG